MPQSEKLVQGHTDRNSEWRAVGIASAACVAAGALGAAALLGGTRLSRWLTPQPIRAVHARLAELEPGPPLDLATALHGREIFEQTCSICHGSNGLGRPSLGKSLVHSDFFADQSDTAMVAFVTIGRPANDPLNTTKVTMPPKGGQEKLTTQDLAAVVTYVRGLQDPRRMPAMPAWAPPAVAPPTEAEKAALLAAAGGDAELSGFIANGTKLFNGTCIACHGPAGVGITGNGKALAKNEFIASQKDEELLAFVKKGRDPGDPKNTTGVGMPPKGGNPALSDDDLLDIISYLRTLQSAGKAGAPAAPPK